MTDNENRDAFLRSVGRSIFKQETSESTYWNDIVIGAYFTFERISKDEKDVPIFEYISEGFRARNDVMIVKKDFVPKDIWEKLKKVRAGDKWENLE